MMVNGQSSWVFLLAQILVGTDCASLFPVSVCNPDGASIQNKNCRLKRSLIKGRYLLFRSSNLHDKLVKVYFPIDGATALETYKLEDDGDYELPPFSLISHQIAPMRASTIVK